MGTSLMPSSVVTLLSPLSIAFSAGVVWFCSCTAVAGALFGMWVGFPLCLVCNTVGSLILYGLSKVVLGDLDVV